ncbi:unnamed protein product [Closterium sp. NIES-64]|nr:unnamed protein product [Closterium sp. NIES-64]
MVDTGGAEGSTTQLVPRPCMLEGNGEMHVISVKFPAVARIGALRIALPTDLRPKEARHAVLVTAEIAEQKLEVLKRRGQLHVQADRAEIAEQKLEVLKRRGELLAVQPRSHLLHPWPLHSLPPTPHPPIPTQAEIAEQKLEVLNWRGQLLAVEPESHLLLAWFPHSRPPTPLPPILTKARIEEQKLEVLACGADLHTISLSLFKSEPGLSAQIQAEKPLTDAQTTASRVPATTADSGEGGMEMCGTIGSAGGVHEGGELKRKSNLLLLAARGGAAASGAASCSSSIVVVTL